MPDRWRLYVDEAGRTDQAGGDPVAIAGILVPEAGFSAAATAAEQVRMKSQFPWLSWPFHRNTFTRPERHLLGFAAVGWTKWAKFFAAQSAPSNPREMLARAAQAAQIAAIVAEVERKRRDPKYGDLEFVKAQMPAAWAPWMRGTADELFERSAELVRAAIERHAGVQAFVAGESAIGDASAQRESPYPFAPRAPQLSRYLALLEVLLRRVGDALLAMPGQHELAVFASGIDVRPARPLAPSDIEGIWNDAFSELAPTRGEHRVSLVDSRVVPYEISDADPWFVVADFASSLARDPLTTNVTLAALSVLARRRIGVDLDVTTTAAAGRLHGFVQSQRPVGNHPAGRQALRVPSYAWAVDQARHWKAVPL